MPDLVEGLVGFAAARAQHTGESHAHQIAVCVFINFDDIGLDARDLGFLGSLEFATQLAGAKLIVVLGHTDCGAIKGAADNAQLGNLTSLLANIRPSWEKLNYKGVASSKDKVLVQKLADQNAKDAASKILSQSKVIRNLADSGKVKVVAAMHDLGTGKISWFS